MNEACCLFRKLFVEQICDLTHRKVSLSLICWTYLINLQEYHFFNCKRNSNKEKCDRMSQLKSSCHGVEEVQCVVAVCFPSFRRESCSFSLH